MIDLALDPEGHAFTRFHAPCDSKRCHLETAVVLVYVPHEAM